MKIGHRGVSTVAIMAIVIAVVAVTVVGGVAAVLLLQPGTPTTPDGTTTTTTTTHTTTTTPITTTTTTPGGTTTTSQPQASGIITSAQLSSETLMEGEAAAASVVVNNTGNTGTTFRIDLISSSGTTSQQKYISAGQSSTLTLDFTPSRNDASIMVRLYAGGIPLNTRTLPITVTYVDGTITSAQLSSHTVIEGETVTASVGINNTGNTGTTFQIYLVSASGTTSQQRYLSAGQSDTLTFNFAPNRNDSSITFNLGTSVTLLDTQTLPITVTYVDLEVTCFSTGEWGRGLNDLPSYTVSGSFNVRNNGTAAASNISLSVVVDETTSTSLGSVSYLALGETYSGNYSTTLWDSAHGIKINAQSDFDNSASAPESFYVSLPRFPYLQEEIMKLYITPSDPIVVATANSIIENKPWWDILSQDWQLIRDWVKNEIQYEYDNVLFGVPDYCQLPRETLALGKGDCEDQAILLASLLRARGFGSDSVYVICGFGEDVGHAWVTFKVFEINIFGYEWEYWRYLEPTSSGVLSGFNDFLSQILGLYESNFGANRIMFNDVSYQS